MSPLRSRDNESAYVSRRPDSKLSYILPEDSFSLFVDSVDQLGTRHNE
jgi:hypothetical protein